MKITKEAKTLSKIFIGLGITVCVISTMLYFFFNNSTPRTLVPIEYTVNIKGIDASFGDNLKTGDTVVSTVTKREIGRINDIAVSPSKMISYDINTNKPKITETGALCDVFIKMSAESEAGQSILVGGVEIKVGKSLYLFTKDLYFEGTVGEIYD